MGEYRQKVTSVYIVTRIVCGILPTCRVYPDAQTEGRKVVQIILYAKYASRNGDNILCL
jgi:hypothetical protein